MASRRDPSRAPTETSANMQCPPRKETRSPSGRCVHRAASSRTYCRPEKREVLKKTRATTSPAFWAASNRRAGACTDSRLHCLPEPYETQPFVVHPDTLPSVTNHSERAHPPPARSGGLTAAVGGKHSRGNSNRRADNQREDRKLKCSRASFKYYLTNR